MIAVMDKPNGLKTGTVLKQRIMAFELYIRGHHVNARKTASQVRVSKATWFYFSKPCTEWLVARGQFVELLFDKQERRIGIRPRATQSHNAYKLQSKSRVSQSTVSLKAFIAFTRIADGVYEVSLDDAAGILSFSDKPNDWKRGRSE